jgi:hypothetical protein
MQKRLISLSIILLALISVLSVFQFVPSINALTIETRYFVNATWIVNGYTYNKLITTQTGASGYTLVMHKTDNFKLGVRIYVTHADSSITELTAGTSVAIVTRSAVGSGIQSATWACPQTTLVPTDAIEVDVYLWDQIYQWQIAMQFSTEQLGTTILNAGTWTFYYYTAVTYSSPYYYFKFYFDTTTYNSRIENFSWGISSTQEVTYHFTETMKPSATLYQWQEQRYSLIETMTITSLLNQRQEQSYILKVTISPSGSITYWEEHLYTFTETTSPSTALSYGIEGVMVFFESFTETLHPLATMNYWQEQSYAFQEVTILSDLTNFFQEQIHIFIETIKPTDILNQWQEQQYIIIETLIPKTCWNLIQESRRPFPIVIIAGAILILIVAGVLVWKERQ